MYTTLIGAGDLATLAASDVRLFDCRFDLADTTAGARRFEQGSIPGAVYLHLDRDLSGTVEPGTTGRHPLPDRASFQALLANHGVEADTQVVAYDDAGGMFAARLWWMVRWAGHARVAVLDRGYQAWLARAGTLAQSRPGEAVRPVPPVTMTEVREHVDDRTWTLLDARANDRFNGRNETIDPKAGHIAGALNASFQDNLDPDGSFLEPDILRCRFESLLADKAGKPVVCYCGSGVTATHNVLAMAHAGMREPALYPGSWSEWITDPDNPTQAGDQTG